MVTDGLRDKNAEGTDGLPSGPSQEGSGRDAICSLMNFGEKRTLGLPFVDRWLNAAESRSFALAENSSATEHSGHQWFIELYRPFPSPKLLSLVCTRSKGLGFIKKQIG